MSGTNTNSTGKNDDNAMFEALDATAGPQLAASSTATGAPAPRTMPRRGRAWRQLEQVRTQARSRTARMGMVVLCSLLAYWTCSQFVMSTVIVKGRSMAPTLRDGDYFILNRLAYMLKSPKRGDMVVIRDPGHSDLAVKRIVGLPGETLLIEDGRVYINGHSFNEAYLARGTQTLTESQAPNSFVLGDNSYFVMGDNRQYSEDSRFYGSIGRNNIVGMLAK